MADDTRYRTMEPVGGETTRVRFSGCFDGQDITWDARLFTLASWYRTLPSTSRDKGVRQFIDFTSVANGIGSLTVGLHVPCIDEPAILKTMVMIRQWKGLRIGRHEYGESHHYGAGHPP